MRERLLQEEVLLFVEFFVIFAKILDIDINDLNVRLKLQRNKLYVAAD